MYYLDANIIEIQENDLKSWIFQPKKAGLCHLYA